MKNPIHSFAMEESSRLANQGTPRLNCTIIAGFLSTETGRQGGPRNILYRESRSTLDTYSIRYTRGRLYRNVKELHCSLGKYISLWYIIRDIDLLIPYIYICMYICMYVYISTPYNSTKMKKKKKKMLSGNRGINM